MNYTHLSGNQYEISLTIFRDCFNGNPNAWFDDPASIGVYNAEMQLIDSLFIDLIGNDTLNPVLSDPCFVIPPNVCVHTTTYRKEITLPPIIGGYTLIYQRCCRNETLQNIVDPLSAGATFMVEISERALLENNSNPKFKDWPPIYICVNEAISFDQSAIDADGDSIVYTLCTPLIGGDPDNSQPRPFQQTVPEFVTWVEPPYNLDNVLGGDPLQINSKTGLLTGIPNTVGQFVVGICVEEFRNGERISTTRRDFQYNVGQCGRAVSSFFAPEVICDDLSVAFKNESINTGSFLWNFGDPTNPDASSTVANPTYTYPDTGFYTITLIAEPGEFCTDTFTRNISLRQPSLTADFDFQFVECSDSAVIKVNDLSTDSLSNVQEWFWVLLEDGLFANSSTEQNPSFVVEHSVNASIVLSVESSNGCTQTLRKDFPIKLIDEKTEPDSFLVCPGESVFLNPSAQNQYQYIWSPNIDIDNNTIANPLATPTQTRIYHLLVTDTISACQVERMIKVEVPELISIDLVDQITSCENNIPLNVTSNVLANYFWAQDSSFQTVIDTGSAIIVKPIGLEQYYVKAEDHFGCSKIDSITVNSLGVNINIEGDSIICLGQEVIFDVQNVDVNDVLSFDWFNDDDILSPKDQASINVKPDSIGAKKYYLSVSNQNGCNHLDSIDLMVLDTLDQSPFISENQCSGYTVNFFNTGPNAAYYKWDFGDPTNLSDSSSLSNPTYTYPDTGFYLVSLILDANVSCMDTIYQLIKVIEPQIKPDFNWRLTDCADSVTVVFENTTINLQSTITNYEWSFSNGAMSNEVNPFLLLTEPQTLNTNLKVYSADGCVDELNVNVPIHLLELNLADSLVICNGEPVFLNPMPDNSLTYLWTPTEGLDDPSSSNPLAKPANNTTYNVSVSRITSDTCQIERTIDVIVAPSFELEIPKDTSICESTFLLFANSSVDLIYDWDTKSNFTTIFSHEPELMIDASKGEQTYYLRASDSFGCEITDSVIISNNRIVIGYPDALSICIGDTIQVNPQFIENENNLNFNWTPKENIINPSDEASVLIAPTQRAYYYVDITNDAGCTLLDSVELKIFDFNPPLDLSAEPDTILLGRTSQLTATKAADYFYHWTPADNLSSISIYNPVASPLKTTIYTLHIKNQDGCSNERSIQVVVQDTNCDFPFVFIPNAFTPNGDDENDVLFVRGNGIEAIDLFIYNRWGEKVFESHSINDGWDGTFKGKELGVDVFGYYLEVRCINGGVLKKQGNISLLK